MLLLPLPSRYQVRRSRISCSEETADYCANCAIEYPTLLFAVDRSFDGIAL